MSSPGVEAWARTVWDYHHVGQALRKADCVIALGCHDTRVAERAARLVLEGWAPLLVLSGGLGSITSGLWTRPEAEVFADVAAGLGVPRERMRLERRSTNTGENVSFSRRLLEEDGLAPRSAIAVHKPYMERRTLATFGVRWPELEVVVTSPPLAFEEYVSSGPGLSRHEVIEIMVGDLQRLTVYARKGFSTPQQVPPEVIAAYDGLLAAGYTKRLLPGEPAGLAEAGARAGVQ
jgi:uncharacterized SAM-binding protein YcdF (DUF218 family)